MKSDDYEVLALEWLKDVIVLKVRTIATGREGWVAGPHGESCLTDWLTYLGKPARTRWEAIWWAGDLTVNRFDR